MKTCKDCGLNPLETAFSKDSRRKDGLGSFCLKCSAVRIASWRALNQERNLEIGRRSSLKYHASEKGHAAVVKSRNKYPAEKKRAVSDANYALRIGEIKKQACEVCGSGKSEMHHEDYSKPRCVRWLCRMHHKQLHFGRFSLLN